MAEEWNGAGAPQGLSWSWKLDFDTLMAAIADAGPSGTASPGDGPARDGSADGSARENSAPCAACLADDAASQEAVQGVIPGRATAAQDGQDDPEPTDEAGGMPAWVLAGRVAERLVPGPDLVAWLALAPPAALDDAGLAAVAGSWRRVASWAQAQELAAVAQIASRAAARDTDIGAGPDGRPARVPAPAAAEIALELTMSQYAAAWWADLAVTLAWRLPGTRSALAAGTIDLARARLIAEATGMLPDEAARAVEDRVLPAAGNQTTGMLRAALRRAVIAADPHGAEDRRKAAERQAQVVLYPDEDHTATLAGQRLPAAHAAAAMARITAMARALKAAGAGGGTGLLSAQVYLGLLLGTLPPIPPAHGAPPDNPPPPDDPPGPHNAPPGDPPPPPDERPLGGSGNPSARPHGNPPGPPGDPPDPPGDPASPPDERPLRESGNPSAGPGQPPGRPADPHRPPSAPGSTGEPRGRPAGRSRPPPGPGPIGDPPGRPGNPSQRPGRPGTARQPPPGQHRPPARDTPPPRQDRPPDGNGGPPADHLPPRQHPPPADQAPPPGDADAPRAEDDYPCPDNDPVQAGPVSPGHDDHDNHDDRWPAEWPGLPAVTPAAFARPGAAADDARAADIRPSDARSGGGRSGLLDISLPWQVLAGNSAGPGHLSRIGPVTASQARRLAECAAGDPAAEWRIIVTTPGGTALAVTRIPRPRSRAPLRPGQRGGPPGPSAGEDTAAGTGLVGRVTLTIPEDLAADPPERLGAAPGSADDILAGAVRAAARAAARARAAAAADSAADGCAHATAAPGYRPPPRLHDHITARDLTCRFPRCRQPAWRADLDHTIPFDDGGLTCRCNLGSLCRTHHLIKHHPGWQLQQHTPGTFTWTTPSGRAFTTTPDTHVV